eukprot:Gb_20884 [translate_table: standard]
MVWQCRISPHYQFLVALAIMHTNKNILEHTFVNLNSFYVIS